MSTHSRLIRPASAPASPPVAGDGRYPAFCTFAIVFLSVLPLTGVPGEWLAWRLAGFVAAGIAAGWMSASGGAALLGLGAGHVVMLLFPDRPPTPTAGYPYAFWATVLVGAGMWIGRMAWAWHGAGAPALHPPPALVRLMAVASGLFPFAVSRPHAAGGDEKLLVGFAVGILAMVALGALSPGNPGRAWRWFLVGHWPFVVLAFFVFVIPAVIDLTVTWFGVWLGSELARDGAGAVTRRAPVTAAASPGRGGGGRMG